MNTFQLSFRFQLSLFANRFFIINYVTLIMAQDAPKRRFLSLIFLVSCFSKSLLIRLLLLLLLFILPLRNKWRLHASLRPKYHNRRLIISIIYITFILSPANDCRTVISRPEKDEALFSHCFIVINCENGN